MTRKVYCTRSMLLHASHKKIEHGIEFHIERVELRIQRVKPFVYLADLDLQVSELFLDTIHTYLKCIDFA